MRPILVLAVLVLAAVAAQPAAAAATAPDCLIGGRTRVASSQVRVIRTGPWTYACWVPGRRVRKLVTSERREDYAVNGRRVAWSATFCDGFTDIRCVATVRIMDVRTGKTVAAEAPDQATTSALVLSARRGAAWIERTARAVRVVAITRAGRRVVLADDPAIRRNSLALRGNTLYWLLGDAPQTAELP